MGDFQLIGVVDVQYKRPLFFTDKLQVSSSCESSDQIVKVFNAVLIALERQMTAEGMISADFQACVFFVDSDDFAIRVLNKTFWGCISRLFGSPSIAGKNST